jgi:hypothetical protein
MRPVNREDFGLKKTDELKLETVYTLDRCHDRDESLQKHMYGRRIWWCFKPF